MPMCAIWELPAFLDSLLTRLLQLRTPSSAENVVALFDLRINKTLKSQYFLKFHVFKGINLKKNFKVIFLLRYSVE